VPYLARWFKVVRPDARGLGQSSTNFDSQRDCAVKNSVGYPAAIIAHRGADAVHYCGESMSGILGMELADMHPYRVRTMTIVLVPCAMIHSEQEAFCNTENLSFLRGKDCDQFGRYRWHLEICG
jgi:3-oxoadipate enol-lactonase